MKLTKEQKKRLQDVLFNIADEDELEGFIAQRNQIRSDKKTTGLLMKISENTDSKEALDRIGEFIAATNAMADKLSSKTGRSIEAMSQDLIEKLTSKLDEVKPKDMSGAFKELSSTLSDIKQILAIWLTVMSGEMKHLKRVAEGWYGGGQTFEFVRLEGAINGTNKAFTIPASKAVPRSDAIILLWHNGAFKQSAEGDFTYSNGTFTLTTAPRVGMQVPATLYEK